MKTSPYQLSSDNFANIVGFSSACMIAGATAFALLYHNPFKTQPLPAPTTLKISLNTFTPTPPKPVVTPQKAPIPTPPAPPKQEVKKIKKHHKPLHKKHPISKPEIKPEVSPKPIKQEPINVQEPTPIQTPKHTQSPKAPKHLSIATSANDERFLRIVSAIKRHQHYPKQALKMKKQGVVEVSFTLLKDGSTKDIRLIKSSGVASLDEAAIKSVQKASKEFVGLDDEYKISLPIAFKIR